MTENVFLRLIYETYDPNNNCLIKRIDPAMLHEPIIKVFEYMLDTSKDELNPEGYDPKEEWLAKLIQDIYKEKEEYERAQQEYEKTGKKDPILERNVRWIRFYGSINNDSLDERTIFDIENPKKERIIDYPQIIHDRFDFGEKYKLVDLLIG